MPCMICKRLTPRGMLSDLGARCRGCFEAYCRATEPARVMPTMPEGPLNWAHTLKHRHDSGQSLSAIQIEAYRKALRLDYSQPEGATQ